MNKADEHSEVTELVTEEGYVLKPRPRPTEAVALRLPVAALASLERVAATRDMSREALMKFYIGQGLRQDLAKLYGERLLEKTAQVLNKHLASEEEVAAILREIRSEAAA